jgi:acetate kinase
VHSLINVDDVAHCLVGAPVGLLARGVTVYRVFAAAASESSRLVAVDALLFGSGIGGGSHGWTVVGLLL